MENSSSDATIYPKKTPPSLFNIDNIIISIAGLYLHYEEMFILKTKFEVNFASFVFTLSTLLALLSYLNTTKMPDCIDKKNGIIRFVYKFVITLLVSNLLQTIVWVYFNKALYFMCHNFAQSMELSIYGSALPRIRPVTEWFKNVPYHVIRNTVSLFLIYKTLSVAGALDFRKPHRSRRQMLQNDSSVEHNDVPQPEVTLIFLPDNVTKYFTHKQSRTGRDRSASRVYDLRPRSKKNQSRDRRTAQK